MQFVIKEWGGWKKRLKPEALTVSGGIALANYALLPLQLGLNLALYETLTNLSPEQLGILAVGAFATSQITTGIINALMIRKFGYCADIHFNVPYMALGLVKGVALGTAINVIWGTVVNPNDWVAWGSIFTKFTLGLGDPSLAGINLISKSALFFSWINACNLGIAVVKGLTESKNQP